MRIYKMKNYSKIKSCFSALLAIVLLAGRVQANQSDPPRQAREILDLTGVQGGMVVHLGCGDGKLTAALRVNDRYTVHGLEVNPVRVAEARKYIQSLDCYGPVSVERFSGSVLPYSENLINLVVMDDSVKVSMAEVMRVLAPGGVACMQRGGKWQKTVKSWPDNIDQWSHFLHDASNNAVADDDVVGPPRSIQWVAPPLWLRSHETPSGIQAPVSANGRLFYFFDEGIIGITDERLPDRWSLICRDAFNGKLLWRKKLGDWGWREWALDRFQGKDWTALRGARTVVPSENQRRIVADGDRLFVTLSYQAPMSILNAATGETITTIEQTRNTSEILISDGIALAYTQQITIGPSRPRRESSQTVTDALVAVQGSTGKVLWQQPTTPIRPLALAIDNGRVVYISGKDLIARDLKDGDEIWKVHPKWLAPKTMLTTDDVIVMQGGKNVAAFDATNGKPLWQKNVPSIGGGEGDDLFVVDGLVWRGMISVDDDGKTVRKSSNALVVGWDLRSGDEKKRIFVKNLRSPEHHHRCYRNKATNRYLISSYEGAEFLDFQADNHSQQNWLRGACKYGMMPCNGMLYVPSDQCFCQPGAKLLGYTAVKTGPDVPLKPIPDSDRLEKGPTYGKAFEPEPPSVGNWPTLRHDAARSGTTTVGVDHDVSIAWQTDLKGRLTAPVAWFKQVFVAKPDAHTVYALDRDNGKILWQYTAAGRIDSPPTIYSNMVLFGSSDGYVYCLRSSDGELVWRFLAAPIDRRIASFDQIESVWPVHGSVLVEKNIAYCTAGRSTYLDGGIRVYALEPATGKILHKGLLKGPFPQVPDARDYAFYLTGANSDVLVSQGGFLYMRQKKLTPDLKEVNVEVLSSKGAQDLGLHVFSTSGLLDDSWYNRTFWMYSQRWPGYQLANQAPKSGQLLVVDDKNTYAVRVFYRRNIHSPMFFPATKGYLLFADANTNEPQIVGDTGWRKPLEWLPQSHIPRDGNPGLEQVRWGFGADKGIGYTRAEPPLWTHWLPVRVQAMVKAGDTLFVAGAPDVLDSNDPYAAFEARKGAKLVAVSAADGKQLAELPLDYPPVFDGLIAVKVKLFASLHNGSIVCLAGK
jgi:outer membrane protein assembly factor BamB